MLLLKGSDNKKKLVENEMFLAAHVVQVTTMLRVAAGNSCCSAKLICIAYSTVWHDSTAHYSSVWTSPQTDLRFRRLIHPANFLIISQLQSPGHDFKKKENNKLFHQINNVWPQISIV